MKPDHSWILEVFKDIKKYCLENDLEVLVPKVEESLHLATKELSQLTSEPNTLQRAIRIPQRKTAEFRSQQKIRISPLAQVDVMQDVFYIPGALTLALTIALARLYYVVTCSALGF